MPNPFHKADQMNVIVARIVPGIDMIEGIAEICQDQKITSGVISCCLGSLQQATYMYLVPADNQLKAAYCEPIQANGPIEILAAQGTIGTEENGTLFVHMHGSICDSQGTVRGGHFVKGGCPVLATVEVMIHQPRGLIMRRTYLPEVGLKILIPTGNKPS